MKNILLLLLLLTCLSVFSQKDSLMISKENELVKALAALRKSNNDSDKISNNKKFKALLYETIQLEGAFDYSFSGLKTLGAVKSDDEMIRVFSWNVEMDDHSQKYFCFILRKDVRRRKIYISELVDNSLMLPARPDGVLDAKNWYGALYYKIIPIEKGSKDMYTLLGMDANNSMSNIKVIDVLYFTGNSPRLGSPIFKMNDETVKRVFFEYSKKAYMSLKYEAEYNRIIYDHLSPETPSMTGFYSYYVPDFSYDAFIYYKSKWILQEAVVGINKKGNEKLKVYVQNKKNGKLELKEVNNKWIDPSDKNSVNGGNTHVARTPELNMDDKNKKKFKINLFKGRRTRRAPQSYSTIPMK